VSHRPLVFLSGLTLGDYLLWSWSLDGNHDVIALVAGLTLPPLAVACIWLLALSVARVLASTARRPRRQLRPHRTGQRRKARLSAATAAAASEASTATAAADRPSRKLAA
jgi:membrane protein implicated in regulation of membrane protease activity